MSIDRLGSKSTPPSISLDRVQAISQYRGDRTNGRAYLHAQALRGKPLNLLSLRLLRGPRTQRHEDDQRGKAIATVPAKFQIGSA